MHVLAQAFEEINSCTVMIDKNISLNIIVGTTKFLLSALD